MKVLVTGGAGYIGSHTCVELLAAGIEVVVADNFSNSSSEVIKRIKEISKKCFETFEIDVCDKRALRAMFDRCPGIDACIHFAGYKAVGESVSEPLKYYENNLVSAINIIDEMKSRGINSFVFSSSATVYGDPASSPITEDFPTSTTNPYGTTKLMIETILADFYKANNDFSIAVLRYFNPIGAHESGRIGENPNGIPNNLLPYITQVAVGKLAELGVFGDDYDTVDGTGVRDYIHVVDLAKGHVAALEKLSRDGGHHVYNLGTGIGYSVLQVKDAFERACKKTIPFKIKPRRPGDIAINFANCSKAKNELGWTAKKTIDDMCADSWRWQSSNPNGYNN